MSNRKDEVMVRLQKLGAWLGAALLLGVAAPACQAEEPVAPALEPLGERSDEGSVGGCKCVSSGSCSKLSYTDVPSDGMYYITTYGGKNVTNPQGCSGSKPADGTWAYVADAARYGCGSKLKIEANGKSCIARVSDCGPNRCVEQAASGSCSSHKPIIDASPFITKHLFGLSGVGYSDKRLIKVTEVAPSTPEGCGDDEGGGGEEAGSSQGGPSGSGSTSGAAGGSTSAKACKQNSECGSGGICDKSSVPYRCVKRKELGESCSNDQDCHGGLNGTSRICENSVCTDACRAEFDCLGTETCELAKGKKTGTCKDAGGCVLNYPSVSIRGITTPSSFKSTYRQRGCSGAPTCVIDTNKIIDAKTGKKLSYKMVKLSPHFSLYTMSHQTVASSPYVYIDPEFIKRLEAVEESYSGTMHVNSGFRSPPHQNKICHGICGKASCPKKCSRCSDHMGGQAADLKHSSPKCALGKKSCNPGQMHLIFNEKAGGDHLHIDIGSKNPVCAYKAFYCGK